MGMLLIALLFIGRSMFIPLIISLLIARILYPICYWLKPQMFSTVSAIALSTSTLVVFAGALVTLLFWQIGGFASVWGKLQIELQDS